MENIQFIDTPKKAVLFLREHLEWGFVLNWHMVGDISELHFLDSIPTLRRHLKCRNDTGLRTLFIKEAKYLTQALPRAMTAPVLVLSSEEAETEAYRITLLHLLADIVQELHNQHELVPYLAKPAAIKKAA